MSSKIEQQIMDSNVMANNILRDIVDVEKMESMLCTELNSEDLFKIDCAILTSLRETKDFSRNLLQQLETGCFETITQKPSQESEIAKIQQQTIMDVTLPLQNLFDEISDFVVDAFV